MKLLLDTHAFLRFVTDDARLSTAAKTSIADPNNLFAEEGSVFKGRYLSIQLPLGSQHSPFSDKYLGRDVKEVPTPSKKRGAQPSDAWI